MRTHAALLRGINVGGNTKVAMPALRGVVEGLGHTDVATYIQSGNVVFEAARSAPDASTAGTSGAQLAAELERAVAAEFGVGPRVLVLASDELAAAIAANPFADTSTPKLVHLIFVSHDPSAALLADIDAAQRLATEKGSPDEVRVAGRVLYLRTPDGYGRSDLGARLNRLGAAHDDVTVTARNMATVDQIMRLLRPDEPEPDGRAGTQLRRRGQ